MSDEEEIGDDELTPEERDAVQQIRNSGMTPGEVVKKAMSNTQTKTDGGAANPDTPLTMKDAQQILQRSEMVAEGAIRRREFNDVVKDMVDTYDQFKGDATDLKQIQAAAAESVSKNPEYAKWSYDETKAKLAEATKAECDRRMGKNPSKAAEKETVEKRLEKESAAVDSGKGGGRSAQPAHEQEEEDFDGSQCGQRNAKAFAMTDQEISAAYSQKAQKFLRKERGQKV